MKLFADQLSISPTDLAYFLACKHRTALELSVAHGVRQRPKWDDPLLEALFAMGLEHEKNYVESLAASGLKLVDLSEFKDRDELVARTLDALRAGADVVVQGALANGRWFGKPDILQKVDRPSPAFGDWSYEIADTKLAKETRGGTILQLGLYCEMLEAAQGLAPFEFHVVTPEQRKTYRFSDFAAYFRLLKSRLESAVELGHETLADANYPEPVEHCDICVWSPRCRDRRRKDDHLSLVAGISRMQRRELEPRGVVTVEQLGALGDPFPFKPKRGSLETYERVRDQARLQIETRKTGTLVYELIPPAPLPTLLEIAEAKSTEPVGLARLPAPSPGDVFLDLEGDPLAASADSPDVTGREYLFGIATVDDAGKVRYRSRWADDAAGERRAFESVMDFITSRWAADPGMHVYHYAPYEPSAFKRLMGRYATREDALDQLLRGRRFVDLYAVVRQGVRAGVERYSIKNLEPLYEFTREVELRDASRALRTMEQAIELDQPSLATPAVRQVIEGYNRDDCVSTRHLRDWLEARRAELIDQGHALPRPPLEVGEASEKQDEKAKQVEALRARLLALAPDQPQAPEYLLAYMLDFHRREDKAGWWEYFRLRELPEDDLLDESQAVAGLEFVEEVEQVKKSFVHRYRYPVQEMEIRRRDKVKTQDGKGFAEVVAVDRDARTLDLLVGPSRRGHRPTALFAHDSVGSTVIADALFALGERAVDQGGVAHLPESPAMVLLMRSAPRLSSGTFDPVGSTTDYAVSIVGRLDRSLLPIQGPPGTGKTFTGGRMICDLVAAGKKVGVMGPSHKVIGNLLHAVAKEAAKAGLKVRLGHKRSQDESATGQASTEAADIALFADNKAPLAALTGDEVDVVGGTAWMWSRPEYAGSVDVLFVDEAGQMSLANTLGSAGAGASMVLLGDPQQLDQPTQGTHPDGVGRSALEHILGGADTMPADRGLFLPVTWRLAPSICRFTSELFYAGQLQPKPGLQNQVLTGAGRFDGSGLYLVPVEHEANRNASDEEARTVAEIVAGLYESSAEWVDEGGKSVRLTPDDIRVVAPFNAHVTRIKETLANLELLASEFSLSTVPVGTVDKFQGQEAPVVIYSMATSHPDDAPRGLRFLYSLNRLNVATSRARCAAIVVASPKLFEVECRTPAQMRLANALCRFREMATVIRLDGARNSRLCHGKVRQ